MVYGIRENRKYCLSRILKWILSVLLYDFRNDESCLLVLVTDSRGEPRETLSSVCRVLGEAGTPKASEAMHVCRNGRLDKR